MAEESRESLAGFLVQIRAGDQAAVERIWERCIPRILAIARKTLAGRPQKFTDADDVAQSAFLSFWTRAARGEFADVVRCDELWKLLTTITVRKALKHQEREHAAKRGSGRVLAESEIPGAADHPFRLDQLRGEVPTDCLDLVCEELLLGLEEDLRRVALLKLAGHQNGEIADALECSHSTIERKLRLIRKFWEGVSP